MRKKLVLSSLLFLTLILASCNQNFFWPTPTPSGVEGYVVSANAGSGIAGVQISVKKGGQPVATVTTGSDGAFKIDLEPGLYDFVASKNGYAGSQVLNVKVEKNQVTKLTIIQRQAFNPNWPTEPPQVTLQWVNEGDTYDASQGPILYRVQVTPQSPLSSNIIYAALGKTPGAGFLSGVRAYFAQTNDTGDAYLNPLDYAVSGPTTLTVVVYDTNGNRTELRRHITINHPSPGNLTLAAPDLRGILAVTLSSPVQFFQVTPQAAPTGGNLWVQLVWSPRYDFSGIPDGIPYGYRIYRSFDGFSFTAIGTVAASETAFVDASSELAPGKKVYYRMTAFIGDQESKPSNVLSTTPLEAFTVSLVSPGDNATGVSVTPTFSWQASATVSPYHYYAAALWDTVSGEMAFLTNNPVMALENITQWTWNQDGSFNGTAFETLQKGRSYEWQVIEAYALDDPQNPTAISVAADGLGLWFPYGVPSSDHFTFTTAP